MDHGLTERYGYYYALCQDGLAYRVVNLDSLSAVYCPTYDLALDMYLRCECHAAIAHELTKVGA
jgi:hypothetical protein